MQKLTLSLVFALLLVPFASAEMDATRQSYLEKSKALAKDDVTGHYNLGLWCEQQGLGDEGRLEFERVIALSPDHAGARQALGYVRHQECWLAHDEAMRAKGLVLHEGAWLLPEEVQRLLLPATEKARMKEEQARARTLLRSMMKGGPKVERMARKAMDSVDDANKVEPLAYALRYPAENVRVFAATELGRIGDRRGIRPLVYRSLKDPSESVREASLASVKSFGDPNMLAPYVKALGSADESIRVNSARAIGELGDIVGIEYLIYRMSYGGGGVSRSHIYIANQLSFIQDFDVEVAQTAFIADPIVGIIQEGEVLDVKVSSMDGTGWLVERRVIRNSLSKLAGRDLGDDPVAWAKWWAENKSEMVKNR